MSTNTYQLFASRVRNREVTECMGGATYLQIFKCNIKKTALTRDGIVTELLKDTGKFHKDIEQLFTQSIQKNITSQFKSGIAILLYKEIDNKEIFSYHHATLLLNI